MPRTNQKWTVVLPCHNKAGWIGESVRRTVEILRRVERSTILIVENGSSDHSRREIEALPDRLGTTEIKKHYLAEAGQGRAFRHAVENIDGDWVVLGSADLPFGTTDLENYLNEVTDCMRERVLAASKLHPLSRIHRKLHRRFMTRSHAWLRWALFQSRVRDTQSTQCYPTELFIRMAPHVRSDSFFFRAELLLLCEKRGVEIVEVPVSLTLPESPTTVRIFADSLQYMSELFSLRLRAN